MTQRFYELLPSWKRSLAFLSSPLLGIFVGALIGMTAKINASTESGLKSFAAGVVLAAVSTELIPEVAEVHKPIDRVWVVMGMLLGVGLLIGLRSIFAKHDVAKRGASKVPWEMVTSVAIDFFVDSLLIGMAMSIRSGVEGSAGLVVSLALAAEMLIVTLSTSGAMKENKVSSAEIAGVCSVFAVVVTIGLFVGHFVATKFKNTAPYYGLLSFGVSALIWLITEELLVNVNTTEGTLDSRIQASLIFVGFLGMIAMGWLTGGHSR